MPAGRPTKYKPEMCDRLIEWGKQGMSMHEMSMELDISFQTFNEWRKEKKEFSEAVKKALEYSQAWWEKLGRHGAAGIADINPTTWIFNMKNRFRHDWTDRKEIESKNTHTVKSLDEYTNDELSAIIERGRGKTS